MNSTIDPSEISKIIQSKIEHYKDKLDVADVGTVIEIGDGISRVFGLKNVMSNELVEFDDGKTLSELL